LEEGVVKRGKDEEKVVRAEVTGGRERQPSWGSARRNGNRKSKKSKNEFTRWKKGDEDTWPLERKSHRVAVNLWEIHGREDFHSERKKQAHKIHF